ncbi:MAG: molybdate ABC transporter substrate-binding protein [Bacteroidota bacterium]
MIIDYPGLKYRVRTLLWIGLLCTVACGTDTSTKLTIAAASSMGDAISTLADQYGEIADIDIQVVLGSSGALAAQVIQGAPYDVFLSADSTHAARVCSHLKDVNGPMTFALGSLILVHDEQLGADLTELLTSSNNGLISVANPVVAPFGEASIVLFQSLGITDNIQPRLVYGQNALQALQFLVSGSCAMAITSRGLTHRLDTTKYKILSIDSSLYDPITHVALPIKKKSDAIAFVNYLQSDQATMVLEQYGYQTKGIQPVRSKTNSQ